MQLAHCHTAQRRALRTSAFTLVEVILAILIIVGILGVVLYFYQQTAEVRKKVIDETEFITTSRMLLDQMTSEFRGARAVESQFAGLDGSSNSVAFVTVTLPAMTRWIIRTNEAAISIPITDLKRIRYSLLTGTNLAEANGLQRAEEYLNAPQPLIQTNQVSTNQVSTNLALLSPAFGPSTTTNSNNATNDVSLPAETPITDQIRFLQFRYWTGNSWTDSWSGMDLPAGVEVTIGHAAMPRESASSEYPFDVFRRVISLPQAPHPGNKTIEFESEGASL